MPTLLRPKGFDAVKQADLKKEQLGHLPAAKLYRKGKPKKNPKGIQQCINMNFDYVKKLRPPPKACNILFQTNPYDKCKPKINLRTPSFEIVYIKKKNYLKPNAIKNLILANST